MIYLANTLMCFHRNETASCADGKNILGVWHQRLMLTNLISAFNYIIIYLNGKLGLGFKRFKVS